MGLTQPKRLAWWVRTALAIMLCSPTINFRCGANLTLGTLFGIATPRKLSKNFVVNINRYIAICFVSLWRWMIAARLLWWTQKLTRPHWWMRSYPIKRMWIIASYTTYPEVRGWYLDGSYIELPFSWKLCVLNWDSRRFRFRVSERKRLPPFGSGENEGWLMLTCIGRIRVISTLLDNATLHKDVERLHLLFNYNFLS
jgi:hypothetical protein